MLHYRLVGGQGLDVPKLPELSRGKVPPRAKVFAMDTTPHAPDHHPRRATIQTLLEILAVSLRLGLTSFGGPVAHLGYFRDEYVRRRKWLNDEAYADLVALCQFLPGPASSQVGISIGMARGGFWGGVASWIGFTLPSAAALAAFSHAVGGVDVSSAGWLHGLLIVAVAVVAHAVWGMASKLAPDRTRRTIAVAAAIIAAVAPLASVQVLIILAAGVFGWLALERPQSNGDDGRAPATFVVSKRTGLLAWVIFFALLAALPVARQLAPSIGLGVADSFFRTGSLVFGGGHVVLPLLESEVVRPGWVSETEFLAGYGAAQAVPGPLFTFAAYLGAAIGGWPMSLLALIAIFAPSFLLVVGALPFWDALRRHSGFRAALNGVNAAVLGILLAALYDPIWTKAILSPADFGLALAAFALLMYWNVPAWAVALLCAAGGAALGALIPPL